MQVIYRAGSLAHTVVHHLLNSGFTTLYATLSDQLPDLIESPELNWLEGCANERSFVLKRYGPHTHAMTARQANDRAARSTHSLTAPPFRHGRLGYIEYANRHILRILDIPPKDLAALIESLETDPKNTIAVGQGLVETRPMQVRVAAARVSQ